MLKINKMKTFGDSPVYPVTCTKAEMDENGSYYGDTYSVGGMNVRQQFAMAAMQGLLANADLSKLSIYNDKHIEMTGIEAVKLADALINALNK